MDFFELIKLGFFSIKPRDLGYLAKKRKRMLIAHRRTSHIRVMGYLTKTGIFAMTP